MKSARQIEICEARTFYKQLVNAGFIEITMSIPKPRSPVMTHIDIGLRTRVFFELVNNRSMEYTVESYDATGATFKSKVFKGRTRVEKLMKYLTWLFDSE